MGSVAHLSEEAHRAAKEFCRRHGLRMSEWVSELIMEAVKGEPPACLPRREPVRLTTPVNPEPTLPGDEPWSKPPFWAGGK